MRLINQGFYPLAQWQELYKRITWESWLSSRTVQLMRLANLLMQKSSSSEHNSEESGTWHFSYLDYLKFMRNMTIPQDLGMIFFFSEMKLLNIQKLISLNSPHFGDQIRILNLGISCNAFFCDVQCICNAKMYIWCDIMWFAVTKHKTFKSHKTLIFRRFWCKRLIYSTKKAAHKTAFSDSEAIRTLDPRLRRALLYPAELRNHP